MIAYIRGKLTEINPNTIVLENQGLGYFIMISAQTYEKLPPLGETCTLFTELQIREDNWQIFGFLDEEEKQLFVLLKTVSGIGARTAIEILSAFPLENLCQAISEKNVKLISKIKGIGKKSAERLVVDLKDKVSHFILGEPSSAPSSADSSYEKDALSALQTLGFQAAQVLPVIKKISSTLKEDEKNSEVLIQKVLQELN